MRLQEASTAVDPDERLFRSAYLDSLTGLANRNFLRHLLGCALRQARRHGELVGVMCVDIDGFRPLAGSFGVGAANELVRTVAERIGKGVQDSDIVARIDEDEFTVVLPSLKDSESAETVARKILPRLSEPVALQGCVVSISTCAAVALYPTDSLDAESLVDCADSAVHRVKQLGRNSFDFYSRTRRGTSWTSRPSTRRSGAP